MHYIDRIAIAAALAACVEHQTAAPEAAIARAVVRRWLAGNATAAECGAAGRAVADAAQKESTPAAKHACHAAAYAAYACARATNGRAHAAANAAHDSCLFSRAAAGYTFAPFDLTLPE